MYFLIIIQISRLWGLMNWLISITYNVKYITITCKFDVKKLQTVHSIQNTFLLSLFLLKY